MKVAEMDLKLKLLNLDPHSYEKHVLQIRKTA